MRGSRCGGLLVVILIQGCSGPVDACWTIADVPAPVRVCFVCSGNICRSPTAEVVFAALVARAGLAAQVRVDSAGTGDWHAGQDMDRRSRATLAAAGYPAGVHSARQFRPEDFAERDLVVALDRGHRDLLLELASAAADPDGARAKIVLLRSYDADADANANADALDVPDPYYGGPDGFADVLGQVERGCAGLLDHIGSTGRDPS